MEFYRGKSDTELLSHECIRMIRTHVEARGGAYGPNLIATKTGYGIALEKRLTLVHSYNNKEFVRDRDLTMLMFEASTKLHLPNIKVIPIVSRVDANGNPQFRYICNFSSIGLVIFSSTEAHGMIARMLVRFVKEAVKRQDLFVPSFAVLSAVLSVWIGHCNDIITRPQAVEIIERFVRDSAEAKFLINEYRNAEILPAHFHLIFPAAPVAMEDIEEEE